MNILKPCKPITPEPIKEVIKTIIDTKIVDSTPTVQTQSSG